MDQAQASPHSPSARSRGFSFHSQNSGSKKDWAESPEEKKRRDSLWKGGSKANPNAALIEAQPGVANLVEQTTISNLRELQHVDANGSVIAEPDLSNPTRPRFERPLDTIRSFEKAIDNGYKRRSSYQKQESFDPHNQFASRRSSYFGGQDNGQHQRGYSQNGGGYYGNQRPDSYYNHQRPRGGSARMQSYPQIMDGGRPYAQHGYHPSADTVQTNGSDSTGPWANSTDPSSENSSIDRNVAHQNGGHGHFNGPIMEDQTYDDRAPQEGYGPGAPPSNRYPYPNGQSGGPVQAPPAARRPIPLGNSGGFDPEQYQGGSLPTNSNKRTQPEEKKKSWLKRRFSKG